MEALYEWDLCIEGNLPQPDQWAGWPVGKDGTLLGRIPGPWPTWTKPLWRRTLPRAV